MQKTREVISDDDIKAVFNGPPTDWVAPTFRVDWDSAPTLEGSYTTAMTYDALNRVKQMIYPEDEDTKNKVLLPLYNRAGALEKVQLKDDNNGSTPDTYVEHIAYNAKGQRLLIAYGNGIMTRYTYDTQTFRLVRLKSEGYTIDGTTYKYSSGTTKQDFKYGYDLAGNIISIRDKTPAAVKGPDDLQRTFEYDALYRLLKATGRECDTPGSNPSWDENVRCHDHTATRTYRREYTYDKMGNILRLKHIDTEDGTNNFTRIFNPDGGGNMPDDYGSTNLLNKINTNSTDYLFEYDANGNQIKENSDRNFEYDYSGLMRSFYQQSGTSEPSKYTHYLYDASGNRTKKITRKPGGQLEVSIIIDSDFEHCYIKPTGTSIDSNRNYNVVHITAGKESRIATVRIGNDTDDSTPAIKYNLEDHIGNSTLHLEAGGSGIWREEYFPFGETSFGSYTKKRYRYNGKMKDEESGLYYYGARYYAAWTCRFTSIDPLFSKYPHYSPYLYAGNKPINAKDIDGLQEQNQTSEGGTTHAIQKGETLTGIAEQHGTKVESIMEANPQISDADTIYAGSELNIPSSSVWAPYTMEGQPINVEPDTTYSAGQLPTVEITAARELKPEDYAKELVNGYMDAINNDILVNAYMKIYTAFPSEAATNLDLDYPSIDIPYKEETPHDIGRQMMGKWGPNTHIYDVTLKLPNVDDPVNVRLVFFASSNGDNVIGSVYEEGFGGSSFFPDFPGFRYQFLSPTGRLVGLMIFKENDWNKFHENHVTPAHKKQVEAWSK